ncbi:hypothetical protein F183_A52840 [Bryobacterales bacterium F-183]|nr:hypothetical protein F183_A52840 [Bryobacterales bacterium F-183]
MEKKLLELVEMIYALSHANDGWNKILSEVATNTEAVGASLITYDLRARQPEGYYTHPYGVELEHFKTYYSKVLPWIPKDVPFPATGGNVVTSESVLSLSKLKQTEFYTDWGRRNEVVSSVAVNLGTQSGYFKYLSIYRGESARAFPEQSVELLRRLAPHLQNAIALHHRMSLVGDLTRALDHSVFPVFVLDRDAKALHLTDRARDLCKAQEYVTLTPNGKLTLSLAHRRTLESEIAVLMSSPASFRAGLLQKPSGHSTAIYILSKSSFLSPSAAPRLVLAILDSSAAKEEGFRYIGQLYDLTPTEIRLIRSLVTTGSLDLATASMDMNRNTAKKHMAAIFEKTSCHRQGQVIQLFASLTHIYPFG